MFTATITSALNKELMEKVQFSPINQEVRPFMELRWPFIELQWPFMEFQSPLIDHNDRPSQDFHSMTFKKIKIRPNTNFATFYYMNQIKHARI